MPQKNNTRNTGLKKASSSNAKIDESYNMDYLPEPHQQKEEIIDHKKEVKNYTKDIPSEDSSKQAKTRNKQEQSSDNGTPEILASIEISDGANKRPFRGVGLLNKSQLKLASYIKQNKNVTLEGTKRFMDKSGEYYLKNIQLQNKRKDNNRKSLNKPQNLENCLNNGNIGKIKKKASKIVTLLPENALTPIPKKDVKDGDFYVYPAAHAAANYSIGRPTGASTWFLPSYAQLQDILGIDQGVNIENNTYYWASTNNSTKDQAMVISYQSNAYSISSHDFTESNKVRACFVY